MAEKRRRTTKIFTTMKKEEARPLEKHEEKAINFVKDKVCEFFDIERELIDEKTRNYPVPDARAIAYRYIHDKYKINKFRTIVLGLNMNNAMYVHYDFKINNEFDLKPTYMKFLKFMQGDSIEDNIDKIDEYVVRKKIEYILVEINHKFKTSFYRDMMVQKLIDLIFVVQNKNNIHDKLIVIYGWFENFANEFFSESDKMISNFDKIGL